MTPTTVTPRLLRPLAATARENTSDRELQLVRQEAERQMATTALGAGNAASTGAEGLSGSLSFLWDAAQSWLGNPTLPFKSGSLSAMLAPLQENLTSMAGRLGDWLRGDQEWQTGLPLVSATPKTPSAPASSAVEALERMTPDQLSALGQNDKAGFFAALRPAAEEAERLYGVPAAVILAQAALETGWGQHIIPGYNLFGHKGTGPAGTVTKRTWEVINGKKVWIDAGFAKYHNFYEAVSYAGQRFHNGYYDKAVQNYARNHDPEGFAKDITGIYATDPDYGDKLISIMRQYDLLGA